jgi:hypothetical protein
MNLPRAYRPRMPGNGVRRAKAAFTRWVRDPPAYRSRRSKWNGDYLLHLRRSRDRRRGRFGQLSPSPAPYTHGAPREVERQITAPNRSYRKPLYTLSLKDSRRKAITRRRKPVRGMPIGTLPPGCSLRLITVQAAPLPGSKMLRFYLRTGAPFQASAHCGEHASKEAPPAILRLFGGPMIGFPRMKTLPRPTNAFTHLLPPS